MSISPEIEPYAWMFVLPPEAIVLPDIAVITDGGNVASWQITDRTMRRSGSRPFKDLQIAYDCFHAFKASELYSLEGEQRIMTRCLEEFIPRYDMTGIINAINQEIISGLSKDDAGVLQVKEAVASIPSLMQVPTIAWAVDRKPKFLAAQVIPHFNGDKEGINREEDIRV